MSDSLSLASDPSADRVTAARALLPRLWAGEDVADDVDALLAAAVAATDVAGECAALYVVCAQTALANEHRRTRDAALRLVTRARLHGEAAWESTGHQYLSRAALREGHEDIALHELATAEILLDDAPDSRALASAFNGIASAYSALSLYEECDRVYARAEEVLRDSTDQWAREASAYNRLLNEATWAAMLLRSGQADEARARLTLVVPRAMAQTEATGNATLRDGLRLLVRFFGLVTGSLAVDAARAEVDAISQTAGLEAEPYARFAVALRLADEGRMAAARGQIADGLASCRKLDDGQIEASLLWLRARIAFDEFGHLPAVEDVWAYASLEARQVWELRVRRLTSARDRAELLRAERSRRDVERLSLEDPLTGIANRRRLDDLRDELAVGRAEGWVTVFYLDIDDFKGVNDDFGHDVGDDVLRTVAARLTECVRAGDVVGRYGGDELVVVAPGCDAAVAQTLAERLLAAVRDQAWSGLADGLRVRVSIGAATSRDRHEGLFAAADVALYDAKRAGRDRAVLTLV